NSQRLFVVMRGMFSSKEFVLDPLGAGRARHSNFIGLSLIKHGKLVRNQNMYEYENYPADVNRHRPARHHRMRFKCRSGGGSWGTSGRFGSWQYHAEVKLRCKLSC